MFLGKENYLYNRKVWDKQHQSRKKLLREGVPQGGVLSPILFIILMNAGANVTADLLPPLFIRIWKEGMFPTDRKEGHLVKADS